MDFTLAVLKPTANFNSTPIFLAMWMYIIFGCCSFHWFILWFAVVSRIVLLFISMMAEGVKSLR